MGLQHIFKVEGKPAEIDEAEIKKTIFELSRPLAQRMSEAYQNNLKISIVRVRAIATGGTLKSVKDEMILESPSRQLVMRRVIASRSLVFVQYGRKPGKAPIKFVGYVPGKRKKMVKLFVPVDGLIVWFNALNIRKALWMPIALAIGRRGIKPREVQIRAVNSSRQAWREAIETFGSRLASTIFK